MMDLGTSLNPNTGKDIIIKDVIADAMLQQILQDLQNMML